MNEVLKDVLRSQIEKALDDVAYIGRYCDNNPQVPANVVECAARDSRAKVPDRLTVCLSLLGSEYT